MNEQKANKPSLGQMREFLIIGLCRVNPLRSELEVEKTVLMKSAWEIEFWYDTMKKIEKENCE